MDATFWLFPACPLGTVEDFLKHKSQQLGKIITVGSTSGFVVSHNNEVISEKSLLDRTKERVCGEGLIRDAGGIIVCASGIYGPQRDPKSWVEKGYVEPSNKYLNLIHVDDLTQILLVCFERGRHSALYIASNNFPQTWNDLVSEWNKEEPFKIPGTAKSSQKLSKKIDSTQTLAELNIQLRYPKFKSLV